MLTISVYDKVSSFDSNSLRIIYNLGIFLRVNDSVLSRFDFYLANVNEKLEIKQTQEYISYAVFSIDIKQLRSIFGNQQLLFEADSSQSKNDNHSLLSQVSF
ncbi:hypothetical protein ABPH35_05445 [Streptococcus sp. ZJ93]|uniref:hypothetical protein n=1 Tax=Streptococcus handemini TaxID=3161188 RepID=UPI0032EB6E4C